MGAWGDWMIQRVMRAVGFAAALWVLFGQAVAAENEMSPAGASVTEPVVVTATRTSTPIADVLSPVLVLDREEIADRQIVSFQDLLAGEPGIQLSNNGGLGKVSSLFLRGFNADHVLVLVNGVRMGSSSVGTTAFQYLPVDAIDHVEVVRGPLSSLYGSEAMGGVIQIFTRRPTVDGLQTDAQVTAGSHRTNSVGASVGMVDGALSYGLSASALNSNGYPNCTGAPYISPSSPGGGCYVYDATPDGFHTASASATARYRFGEESDLEFTLLRAQGNVRYAGSYTNHEDFVQQSAALASHWMVSPTLRVMAQIGQSRDNALDNLDGVEPDGNRFDTTRNSASLQGDWRLAAAQLLTLGAEYLRDELNSDAGFPVTARTIHGIFGEYQTSLGAQQLTLSARRDQNSQFGQRSTGSAAWGYRLSQTLRLTASVGTAFHAPSFDDLYFPNFGNPALKPETARSLDVGLDWRATTTHGSAHVFESHVQDLIGYDMVQFAPENTDRARIRGLELEVQATRGPWIIAGSAAWLDARNQTPGSANFGNRLPRRAQLTSRLEVARAWRDVRVALRTDLAGRRYEDLANLLPLGGYVTTDLRVDWTPRRAWTLQFKVANAADRAYQTALYYPQDGRNVWVTVRYHPIPR